MTTTDDQAVVAHYEQLRERATTGKVSGVRHGLAVLMQKGMAAWMETCSGALAPRQPPPRIPERRLVDERCGELVEILANMALHQLSEVRI